LPAIRRSPDRRSSTARRGPPSAAGSPTSRRLDGQVDVANHLVALQILDLHFQRVVAIHELVERHWRGKRALTGALEPRRGVDQVVVPGACVETVLEGLPAGSE